MRTQIALLIATLPFFWVGASSADEYVPGHYEPNGAYVGPHWERHSSFGHSRASTPDDTDSSAKKSDKPKARGAPSSVGSYSLYSDPYYAYRPPVPLSRSGGSNSGR